MLAFSDFPLEFLCRNMYIIIVTHVFFCSYFCVASVGETVIVARDLSLARTHTHRRFLCARSPVIFKGCWCVCEQFFL